jgi:hypothetical protein
VKGTAFSKLMHQWRTAALLVAACALAPLGGCWAATAASVMAESYRRTSTRTVEAEYRELEGKTFAVFIAADRVIQADRPQLIPQLTNAISERLRANTGAAGYVPGPVVLQFQYTNPGWEARTYGELAEEFGVDRLIYIDLYEHRLYERGNSYLWDGLLAGVVGVVEADSGYSDDFLFARDVAVRFPDSTGYSSSDFSEAQISAVLMSRFVDRVTWLFYDHKEPYYPDY